MYNANRRELKGTNSSGNNNPSNELLTYKDVSVLSRFINEQGKILPRRVTGLPSKEQKKITRLVKQARIAALLPFVIGKS